MPIVLYHLFFHQAILVMVFLTFSKQKMYTEVKADGSIEDLQKRSLAGSQTGLSDHYSSGYGQPMVGSSQSISCAPGMTGYITGNSYRNRLGMYYTFSLNH